MPGPTLTHTQKVQRLTIAGSALLALLLLVIALVWWNDNKSSRQSVATHSDSTSLRIERPGFATIALQKQAAEQWRIVEPCDLPVNARRLQPLLDSLTPAAHSYASSEVDLAAAGLLAPEAILYLDEQRLALGKTDHSGERRYLQRGDRVEFAPEWILSLVNGGLSALALPEVFPQGLDAIRFMSSDSDSDSGTGTGTGTGTGQQGDALSSWQALTAQQITSWPLPDNETAVSSQQWLADSAGKQQRLTLHDFQRFAAIRFENAACAYIIPRTSLPESVFP